MPENFLDLLDNMYSSLSAFLTTLNYVFRTIKNCIRNPICTSKEHFEF